MEIAFWVSLAIIVYTFVGYGILLWMLVRVKRLFTKPGTRAIPSDDALPTCCLIIAAYNEESEIEAKIANSVALDYPRGKLSIVFVTDGSDDGTPDIVAAHPEVKLLHQPERRGKIHAVHRAVMASEADILVFTDANTILNAGALRELCKHYQDPTVGAVSGEKRIAMSDAADASTAGEGIYWKYESALKRWDAELHTLVGSAGELFSVRRSLYRPVPPTTVLDDFMISMNIARIGYRVAYEPGAYALETASEDVAEELKRKVRIAAGGIQSVVWLWPLLVPFRRPLLTFQYISHRVLRWTVTPFMLVLLFLASAVLAFRGAGGFYEFVFFGQVVFYALAGFGWYVSGRQLKAKIVFISYYFCVMNYAVIAGILRFLKGRQSAAWEKSRRKQVA